MLLSKLKPGARVRYEGYIPGWDVFVPATIVTVTRVDVDSLFVAFSREAAERAVEDPDRRDFMVAGKIYVWADDCSPLEPDDNAAL